MTILKFSNSVRTDKLLPNFFGDIRISDNNKFYTSSILDVQVNGTSWGIAEVVGIKEFSLKRLTDSLSFFNCGKSAPYQAKLLKFYYPEIGEDTMLMHVVFKWKTRNIKVQETYLDAWWKDVQEQHFLNQPQTNLFS